MLRGQLTGLRARRPDDIPLLHSDLYEDVATRVRADTRPWRPIPPDSPSSPYRAADGADDVACFSVVELDGREPASGELAGEALLWGVDRHNRVAHIGVSLRPSFRGRGLGADCVRVLCGYGFDILGMNRLQIETLADNEAMIRAAERSGFRREGRLRASAWVDGEFADEVVFGLLAGERTAG